MPRGSAIIRDTLDQLRRKVRTYVWVEGVAATMAVAGLMFWIALLLDWLWEPNAAIRVLGWLIAAGVACGVFYQRVLRRAFVPLRDAALALVVERRFADLDETLLTAVEAPHAAAPDATYEMLLDRATDAAETRLGNLPIADVLDYRPLLRGCVLAVTAAVTITAFAVWQPDAFAVWVRRLALSEEIWPRRTVLRVEGFAADKDGQRIEKIPPDDRFELTVWADLTDGHEAPATVEIRFRHADGRRGRDSMARIGTVRPEDATEQRYRYAFQDVATDLQFDVIGGDGRVRDLMLRVVPRPRIIDSRIHCEYPSYMRRPAEQLDVTGTMPIPAGTAVRLVARTTKPLDWIRIHDREMKFDHTRTYTDEEDRHAIKLELPRLDEDVTLLITLRDTDGIQTREPIRLTLVVTEDPPPHVAVRPAGIGTLVTASARIPFQGNLTDPHYGMKRAWFTVRQADREDKVLLLEEALDGRQELRVDHAVDLRGVDPDSLARRLDLHPSDSITITVYASDYYDLSEQRQPGESQTFAFEIVTPEKLLSVMQRQELSLRQRFESIYQRVSDTRGVLSRIQTPSAEDSSEPIGTPNRDANGPSREDRRRLRVAGVLQNVAQAGQETTGVAEGFEGITLELVNNRLDTPELLRRLKDQIAGPLREIAENDLVLLEKRVEALQSELNNRDAAAARLKDTVDQVDVVLIAMEQVLESMLELESYNEVVQLLQEIIEDQQRLNQETKEQQKARLRGLLDE